jgi:2-polyprenyl-3-methyl-5-hydroxy-6-metoxy-1,4-benzoquinol methylase
MIAVKELRSSSAWPASGLEQVEACPVCGCRDRSLAYGELRDRVFFCAPGLWNLYECGACRCCYLDPRPTRETVGLAYARYFTHRSSSRPDIVDMRPLRRLQRMLANGYRNRRHGTRDEPSHALGWLVAWLLPRNRALMDAQMRRLPRPTAGSRLLDIGCGDGAFLHLAQSAGWEVVGIDFDVAAVESARRRGLDVRCQTVEALAGESASPFDAITISHVIEHVHDPADLLRHAFRLLKPGGTLWVDTPNLSSIGRVRFGHAWIGLDAPRHLVLFNPVSLRRLLERTGFTILETVARFEVSDMIFEASYRIARCEDPYEGSRPPVAIRLGAVIASIRSFFQPELSEFLTVVAARPR